MGAFATPLPPHLLSVHTCDFTALFYEWYDSGLMIKSPAYINHAGAILDSDSWATSNQQHVRTYNKLLEILSKLFRLKTFYFLFSNFKVLDFIKYTLAK